MSKRLKDYLDQKCAEINEAEGRYNSVEKVYGNVCLMRLLTDEEMKRRSNSSRLGIFHPLFVKLGDVSYEAPNLVAPEQVRKVRGKISALHLRAYARQMTKEQYDFIMSSPPQKIANELAYPHAEPVIRNL